MTKLKSKNVFFSEENIKRLVASESEFQSLKTNRAELSSCSTTKTIQVSLSISSNPTNN